MLLADYHLDDGTGFDVIDFARSRHGENIRCVLVTADRSPALKAQAERRDVIVLYKPVKPAALRAVLGARLPTRQAAE